MIVGEGNGRVERDTLADFFFQGILIGQQEGNSPVNLANDWMTRHAYGHMHSFVTLGPACVAISLVKSYAHALPALRRQPTRSSASSNCRSSHTVAHRIF